ncbi:hypothetical protein SNEBB_009189 [Seison nebaliae]|nr:hypothetical protein SNEBB_009189 [Seison nebaliae]
MVIGIGLPISSAFVLHRFYFAGGRCISSKKFSNDNIIITGANCGIGEKTALDLVKRGARVILACRDVTSGKKALDKIRQNVADIHRSTVMHLDLANFDSVRNFVDKYVELEGDRHLHSIICNAGVMRPPFQLTVDGNEQQFQTNHLSHFLLVNRLLELVVAKNKEDYTDSYCRILLLSSIGYKRGKKDELHELREEIYEPRSAYCSSKLANVYHAKALAYYANEHQLPIEVCSIHPGIVLSNLGRNMLATWRERGLFYFYSRLLLISPIALVCLKTTTEGSQTSIHCATVDKLKQGAYYTDCSVTATLPIANDIESRNNLIKYSEKLTKSSFSQLHELFT